MLHLVIDPINEQKRIITRIKNEYAENQRHQAEVEEERLGIKQKVSDLEHMLGTPQFKIGQIIDRLECITPDEDDYPKIIKQLRDIFDYMKRLIHYSNALISSETFEIEQHNISDFIKDYVEAWNNYGGNIFNLSVRNDIKPDCMIMFDKRLMIVMLDAILTNASKHGFKKIRGYNKDGNSVEIHLMPVLYLSKPYLRISIANNGDAPENGFTIQDYIKKGYHSPNTDGSGLGGYHVYQIVKGHGGCMSLDSNKIWSFIINVLLPVDNLLTENFVDYEAECI